MEVFKIGQLVHGSKAGNREQNLVRQRESSFRDSGVKQRVDVGRQRQSDVRPVGALVRCSLIRRSHFVCGCSVCSSLAGENHLKFS